MEEIRVKLDTIYKRLQTLDITPTLKNMEKLIQTLYDLKDIYNEMGENDGGDKAVPE